MVTHEQLHELLSLLEKACDAQQELDRRDRSNIIASLQPYENALSAAKEKFFSYAESIGVDPHKYYFGF